MPMQYQCERCRLVSAKGSDVGRMPSWEVAVEVHVDLSKTNSCYEGPWYLGNIHSRAKWVLDWDVSCRNVSDCCHRPHDL